MERLVTSLLQSQWLKEAGAPQDTANVWIKASHSGHWFVRERVKGHEELSSFTLQELMEWLGDDLEEVYHDPQCEGWFAYSTGRKKDTGAFVNPLEAVFNLCSAIHERGND